MCIIAVNVLGSILSEEVLNNCWDNNPDGAGIMYAVDNQLHIYKTLEKNKLIEKYNEIRTKYPDIDIVLHFRLATHGSVNIDNTHPVIVNKDLAFVHNGIIREVMHTSLASRCKDYSDSRIFGEMLKGVADKIFEDKGLQELLESYIGHSKIVFMDNCGRVLTLNELYGVYDVEGNWFSNQTYLYKAVSRWSPKESTINSGNKYKGYRVFNDPFDFDELDDFNLLDKDLLEDECKIKSKGNNNHDWLNGWM